MSQITPELRAIESQIRNLANSPSAEARLKSRAEIIVARVYEGRGSTLVGRELRVPRQTIAKWVDRFLAEPGVEALRGKRLTSPM